MPADPVEPKYDVALSFAGENRAYVDMVAAHLRDAGVELFYDNYEQVNLWGKDLYTHLAWVYGRASRFCVLFASESYAKKVWTNHERQNAQSRAIKENSEYVLPARFDDTEIPGLVDTVGHIDLRKVSEAQLANMIIQKLGPRPHKQLFPSTTDQLWREMEIPLDDVEECRRTQEIAYDLYRALARMTEDERFVVTTAFHHGCPGELPDGVHISLNLLHRLTGRSPADLLDTLASVRPLNVKVLVRANPHEADDGELVPEDRDLFLSYWAPSRPESEDATSVVYEAIVCASSHLCDEHGIAVLTALDFGRLSTGTEVAGSMARHPSADES